MWMTITEKGETFSSSVYLIDEDFTLRMVSERTRSGAGSLTQDMEMLAVSQMTDVEAPWSSDYDRNTLRVQTLRMSLRSSKATKKLSMIAS